MDPNDLALGEMAQDCCDACFVSLRSRDGDAVRRYDVVGVIAH